jgi:hypothetical protein
METEGAAVKKCPPHRSPWNSKGPIADGSKTYTLYSRPDCGQEMQRRYD